MTLIQAESIQATRNQVRRSILHSQEQADYWTLKKAQATRVDDRAAAGARILVWQSNTRGLEAKLKSLSLAGKGAA